ncbi:hypothetical protein COP1_022776 [Malus domestica]
MTLLQPLFPSVSRLSLGLFWEARVLCRNLSRCRVQSSVLKLVSKWLNHWPKHMTLHMKQLWIPKMAPQIPSHRQGILQSPDQIRTILGI